MNEITTLPQSTRRKLSLLHLAQELQNISKACRLMGYHRDSFAAGVIGSRVRAPPFTTSPNLATCCLRVPPRTNLRRPRKTQAQVIPTITT